MMNLLILTKISKYTLVGSLSAALSFIGKHNASFKLALSFILVGITIVTLIAIHWEGRRLVSTLTSEEELTGILNLMNGASQKRNYLLSPQVRLEIIIGLLVALVFSLVGTL